jgi:adenylate cyclase
MLATLPTVTNEWMNVTQTELRMGIGVHTGCVQVGNAGSARKAKYGPRGPNVNLASRVEAATKELGVAFLATQSTVDKLTNDFVANRICRALMSGLQQPVDLYIVRKPSGDERLEHAWRTYDDALREFERGAFDAAANRLAAIDDSLVEVPLQFLSERVRTEQGRNLRRRESDKPIALPAGVIPLAKK